MDLNKLKTNKAKEAEGVWIDGPDDVKIKVTRWFNQKHKEYLTKNGSQIRALAAVGMPIESESIALNRKAVANCILLDWKNVQMDGKDLTPYKALDAEAVFEQVPDFFQFVITAAQDMQNFRDEAVAGKQQSSGKQPSGT